MMDEPNFAALDALTRDAMQRLLAGRWRETRKTVIYVTQRLGSRLSRRPRGGDDTRSPGA